MMGYRFKQTLILDKANFTYLIFDQHFTQHKQKDLFLVDIIRKSHDTLPYVNKSHLFHNFSQKHDHYMHFSNLNTIISTFKNSTYFHAQ